MSALEKDLAATAGATRKDDLKTKADLQAGLDSARAGLTAARQSLAMAIQIEALEAQVAGLMPPHEMTKAEKAEVVAKVKAIIGRIDLRGESIIADLRGRFAKEVPEAVITVLGPPPVRGVGRAGGFKIMVEDRGDNSLATLQGQTDNLIDKARTATKVVDDRPIPVFTSLAATFRANVPQFYVDVNRAEVMTKDVRLQDLFDTLRIYLGSLYVNDFNRFGRTWQVIVQADPKFRNAIEYVPQLKVRNTQGTMVPVGTLASLKQINGPLVLTRYNMYPAAPINGAAAPGISSGEAIAIDGGARQAAAPQVDDDRVDRAGVPRAPGRQHGDHRLRLRRGDGLPGAGGAVRELVAAAGDHPGGADVPAERGDRRADRRRGHQHLHADRFRRAGRPGEQERDPDRRVRQAAARRWATRGTRPRWTPARCGSGRSS